MDQRITPNFWLSELMMSQYAVRYGIANVPSTLALVNLRQILAPGLQRVRGVLNAAMLISSAFRSPELNKAIGGASNSQHMDGLAADFTAPGFGSPIKVCRKIIEEAELIGFQQIIAEGRWVHIGFPPAGEAPKFEVLTAHFGAGGVAYSRGLS